MSPQERLAEAMTRLLGGGKEAGAREPPAWGVEADLSLSPFSRLCQETHGACFSAPVRSSGGARRLEGGGGLGREAPRTRGSQ